ncbi:pyrroline-5-carboxylate reductase [Marinoscillum sp. MHG1-6]|uniref:pyrroline-5-carboxylate reductase n=1 Tax=Marinoscillum sp. MHG1-6 TaxID=2959627 RepID=UPI002157A9E9|nr:pyrroline-5-carboxylate reductase [Marinoscillum sp. MHG1-6]
MSQKHIAIIGAGNLGISIAEGIVDGGLKKSSEVFLTRRHIESISYLKNKGYQTITSNLEAVKQSRIVMLCVQPKQLPKVLEEINPVLTEDHVLVSVITGVMLAEIEKQITVKATVIRAMPNTAIAIGESMTCITSNGNEAEVKEIQALFDALGKTLVIDEKLMQAATVLGASGIAFFMRFLRAATQGGVQMGFHSEEAQLIAVQTAKGAASLILENGNHPEVEIDKVTTPQGCTIEGLNEMEHQGLSSAIIKGLMASYERISNIK